MNIIRDEENSLMMIPLFMDWHVHRCNVAGCKNKPTTIISQLHEDLPLIGMCEEHFQNANQGYPVTYTFEFDNYDAFKEGTS
jgi:hypothetical protein